MIDLACIRCGVVLRRERRKENYRHKRGCSTSCAARLDDPRLAVEPNPVLNARWLHLTYGKFALVDEDVFDKLNLRKWRWQAGGKSVGYAASGDRKSFMLLHHAVLNVPTRTHIDHRNNNGLDCRLENLRPANRQDNGANRDKFVGRLGRTFTSRYKGVIDRSRHLASGASPWLARIRVDGQLIHIGRFNTEHEAALAYDDAAVKHFGEFARPNFPVAEMRA